MEARKKALLGKWLPYNMDSRQDDKILHIAALQYGGRAGVGYSGIGNLKYGGKWAATQKKSAYNTDHTELGQHFRVRVRGQGQ